MESLDALAPPKCHRKFHHAQGALVIPERAWPAEEASPAQANTQGRLRQANHLSHVTTAPMSAFSRRQGLLPRRAPMAPFFLAAKSCTRSASAGERQEKAPAWWPALKGRLNQGGKTRCHHAGDLAGLCPAAPGRHPRKTRTRRPGQASCGRRNGESRQRPISLRSGQCVTGPVAWSGLRDGMPPKLERPRELPNFPNRIWRRDKKSKRDNGL